MTSAICNSGHIVSNDVIDPINRRQEPEQRGRRLSYSDSSVRGIGYPQPVGDPVSSFCGMCGAPVTTTCGNCSTPIPQINYLSGAREPNAFCTGCAKPFPWANRAQLIGQLRSQLNFEIDLTDADRLDVIDAIDTLAGPEDSATDEIRIKAGQFIKRKAPKAWAAAQPVLTTLLSSVLQQALHLP